MFDFLKKHFGTTVGRGGYPAVNVDIVVDCAGAPNVIDEYLQFRKPKSRLSIVGVSSEPILLNAARIMSSEAIIQGSRAYDTEDIQEVIENLASQKTCVSDIITHHFPLERINEAFEMASDRKKAIKVIVDMD